MAEEEAWEIEFINGKKIDESKLHRLLFFCHMKLVNSHPL